MFFKYFPRANYVIDNKSFTMADIFRRASPRDNIVDNLALELIAVRDGQTPEALSFDYYGDVKYYWTILIVNEIIDPYNEWVRTTEDLYEWSINKYGSAERLRDPHHYVFAGTDIQVDYDEDDVAGALIVPITNYEYEVAENEKKRTVRLIKREFIEKFVKEFDEKMNRKYAGGQGTGL